MHIMWPAIRAFRHARLLGFLLFSLPLVASGTFTVSVTPSSLSIPQGGRETATIVTTISGGFNSSISLSASAVPGVLATFNPATIPAPGAGVSSMTLTLMLSAPTGTYPITVNAVGGGIKQTATLTLTITGSGQPAFTLTASPPLLSIVPGGQGNSTITTTVNNSFNSNISLSASGMPAGISVSFNPQTIPAPGAGSSTMNVTVSSTTAPGVYPLTVTASGGGLWQETAVTVEVGSFTISASPASLTIAQGNQGSSQITTTISGGFNNPVSLSSSGAPSGTSVTFNPQTIPAPGAGSSTMTIIVGNNTPAGTYPIIVTGSGGGLLQNVTVTLTVTSGGGGGFTLAVTPSSLSLVQNKAGLGLATTRINGGFSSSIILSFSGAPAGVYVGFNPQIIAAPGVGNSTMNISTLSAAPGVYPITITATGGGTKQSVTFTLTITAAGPNFTLSAAPASLSVVQGNQAASSVNSTLTGSFNSAISLSASGMPSGVNVSFSPATLSAPGNGNSVTTITTQQNVTAGTYPITVTGNGGGNQQTTTIALTVTPSGAQRLPNADFLQPYSYQLEASFGTPPYTYQLVLGSLPAGITLSTSGYISGAATTAGAFPFSVLVTDSSQPPKQQTFNYTLNSVMQLDTYSGVTAAPVPGCTQAGYFQVLKVSGRWTFADPQCNAFYRRSVYDADRNFILQQIMQERYNNNTALWATHTLQRITGWGFNATDIYSSLYMLPVPWGNNPAASVPIPFVLFYPALRDVLWYPQQLGLPEAVKDICRGFDNDGYNNYCLNLVDVFDPEWTTGNQAELANQEAQYTGGFNTDPWVISISLGDSDFVFAIKGNGSNPYGANTYPHAGMMIATVNFQYSGYQDPYLHAKFAWACGPVNNPNPSSCNGTSYLEQKYGTIAALNAAWGSNYTTFGDAGGFGSGTGVLDEDGRDTAWFGSDYFNQTGMNANLKADIDAFLYQYAYQAYAVQVSTVQGYDHNHLMECGDFGGVGEGGMRPQVMQALRDAGCNLLVGDWNSTYPAMALSGNQAEYDAVGLPVVLWYGISSQADSDTSQYPNNGASFANYPSQFARGQQYALDQQSILSAQGSNGDYYIMGTAFWGLTDNSSEDTNWGMITFMDNAYDGQCAVVNQGTDKYGYPCGGEAANYGDFLDSVTQSNSSVVQQFVQALLQ